MAALTNHENIQNNINQEAPTTTTPEVNKADTTGITFGKAKKVGKSTTEYEVSFDDDNARKTTGGSKKMTLQERFAATEDVNLHNNNIHIMLQRKEADP